MEANEDTAYSAILERAADLLTGRTWNKGSLFKKKGIGQICMCVHGAVRAAAEPKRLTTSLLPPREFIIKINKDIDGAYKQFFKTPLSLKNLN